MVYRIIVLFGSMKLFAGERHPTKWGVVKPGKPPSLHIKVAGIDACLPPQKAVFHSMYIAIFRKKYQVGYIP